jgi:hypothetical protein
MAALRPSRPAVILSTTRRRARGLLPVRDQAADPDDRPVRRRRQHRGRQDCPLGRHRQRTGLMIVEAGTTRPGGWLDSTFASHRSS